jgi:hypothetical protein
MTHKHSSILHRAFSLLLALLSVGSIHLANAQPFAPAGRLPGVQEHKALPPPTTAASLVTQLNAEGALGFEFMFFSAFGGGLSPSVSSLFVRNTSRPKTYTYKTLPVPTSPTSLVNLMNTEGAMGFRYFGDQIFNFNTPQAESISLFVKDSSNATYTFKHLTPASDEATFLAQANAEGALGFTYISDIVHPIVGGFLQNSFYVKENNTATQYSYESRPPSPDLSAFITQANSQGNRSFRYRGDLIIGGVRFSLSMKNSSTPYRYTFESQTPGTTAAAYVTQANGEGARGFAYYSDYVFQVLSPEVFSFYVSAGGTPRDSNGDGSSDVLLRSGNTGQVNGYLMNGIAIASANVLIGPGGWTATHTGDLNGDGKADILWRNNDGTVAAWLMNGLSPSADAVLMAAGSGWSITHVADLNGDGKADILWQHTDGRIAAWLMNGTTPTAGAILLGAGTGYSISHTADLNGDGKADILFKGPGGIVATWIMNGLSISSSATLLGANTGFSISHIADLNGDGKADILWQNGAGVVTAWLMDGTSQIGNATLQNAGSGWSITHTADLNADGKADILWQHTDGRVAAWTMNGTTPTNGAVLMNAGTGWSITQMADGKADIVWKHTDGRIAIWQMDTFAITGAGVIFGPGANQVLP